MRATNHRTIPRSRIKTRARGRVRGPHIRWRSTEVGFEPCAQLIIGPTHNEHYKWKRGKRRRAKLRSQSESEGSTGHADMYPYNPTDCPTARHGPRRLKQMTSHRGETGINSSTKITSSRKVLCGSYSDMPNVIGSFSVQGPRDRNRRCSSLRQQLLTLGAPCGSHCPIGGIKFLDLCRL